MAFSSAFAVSASARTGQLNAPILEVLKVLKETGRQMVDDIRNTRWHGSSVPCPSVKVINRG